MPENIITKTCSKCKKPKGLNEFYRRKSGKLGRDNRCKACHAIYAKSERGKETRRKADQLYRSSPKRKALRKKTDKYYHKTHPERIKARYAVNYAIRAGRLARPDTFQCSQECGKQATMWHHWRGYEPEHWLDVIPLCRTCDRLAHTLQVLMV